MDLSLQQMFKGRELFPDLVVLSGKIKPDKSLNVIRVMQPPEGAKNTAYRIVLNEAYKPGLSTIGDPLYISGKKSVKGTKYTPCFLVDGFRSGWKYRLNLFKILPK